MTSFQAASVDADFQLRVHIERFEEGITAHGIADVLGLSSTEILTALGQPANTGYCTTLYDEIRLAFGPSHKYTQVSGVELELALPPPQSLSQEEQAEKILDLEVCTDGNVGNWPLPRSSLVVPADISHFSEIERRLGSDEDRRRLVELYDMEGQEQVVQALQQAVEKLEKELGRAFKRTKDHGALIPAVQKARSVIVMQRSYWEAERKKKLIGDVEAQHKKKHLDILDEAVGALGKKIVTRLRTPHEAKLAANKLIVLLGDSSAPHGGIPALLEVMAEARWNVAPAVRTKTINYLQRAVAALAVSPSAERFLKEHGLDLIESHCRDADPKYNSFLGVLSSDSLLLDLHQNWEDTIEELRLGYGAEKFGSSPFVHVVTFAKVMGSAFSIASALLTPTTFASLLTHLHRHTKSASKAGRKLATLGFRFLTAPSVPNFPKPDVSPAFDDIGFRRAVSEADERYELVALIDKADKLDPKDRARFWRENGEILTEKQLTKRYLQHRPVTGILMTLNLLLLAASITSDEDDPFIYSMSLVGAILGTAQAATGVARFFVSAQNLHAGSRELAVLDDLAGKFGRAAGVIGLVTSIAILAKHAPTETTSTIVLDSFSVLSGTLTAAAWLTESLGLTAAAAGLGLAAAVVGIGVLVAAIAIDILTPGAKDIIEAYLDFVEDNEEGARFPIEISAVRKAFKKARTADSFSDFRGDLGSPFDDPRETEPSLYIALVLGFTHHEISRLFDMSPAAVATVLPTEEELRAGGFPI